MGKPKKSTEQFKQEVYNLVNNSYTVLENYINTDTHILMRHNECGYEWKVLPYRFLQGTRCPKCSGSMKLTTKSYKNYVQNTTNNEYLVLGEYKNNKTKIEMLHTICNNKFMITPNHFKTGDRCPYCRKNKKLNTEIYKQRVSEVSGSEYTVLSEYVNIRTEIRLRHNKCGYEYSTVAGNFLDGYRCPKCNESKGEKKIAEFLDAQNIFYERQKKFSECKHVFPLPFDFYLPAFDTCIEYDGIQHYEARNFYGSCEQTDLNLIRKRDSIKDSYCIENNIGLIRISYKDFNRIDDILLNDLREINEEAIL